MKVTMNLILASVLAVSCINLNGQLNVRQVMTVKKKGGFLNLQTKEVKVQPGMYSADLKINSAKSFTLKLNTGTDAKNEIAIPIKSNTDFNIPTNGNVIIRHDQIAQPFDLSGKIETNITESAQVSITENCTFTRTERRCDTDCNVSDIQRTPDDRRGPGHDPRGPGREDPRPTPPRIPDCRVECHDVLVSYPGEQFVQYHNRYTARDLKADLLDVNSKDVLASFSGSGTESDRINDYIGECR